MVKQDIAPPRRSRSVRLALALVLGAVGLPVLAGAQAAEAAIPPPGTPPPLKFSYSYKNMRGPGMLDGRMATTSPSVGPVPVNLATGNLWTSATDLALPGRGVPAQISRTYNAQSVWFDGLFGYGWTSMPKIYINGFDYNPDLYDENGNSSHFVWSATAKAYINAWNQWLIPKDGHWVLTRHDQTTLTFTPPVYLAGGGDLVSIKDENGLGSTIAYSNNLPSTITDAAGRKLTLTYTGTHIQKVTDPAGRTVSYAYDGASNLVAVTDPNGNVTRYGYDTEHHMVSVTSPRGGVTKIGYATIANFAQVTSQTDPLGRVTKYSYTAAPWLPDHPCPNDSAQVTSPGGVVTTDTFVNCAVVQHKVGNSGWSYSYETQLLGITKVVDPNLHTTTNDFDGNGNLASTTNALGNVAKATYSPTNKTLTTTDPLGHVTASTYDAKGNLTKVTRGAVTTTYAYADANHPGDRTSMTDPEGKVWRYTYDAYGLQTSVTDPLGNVSRQAFDSVGRQVSSTAPSGAVTRYTTDKTGRVTAVTDPLGRVTRTAYDANSNVMSLTEPSGTVTTTTYDAANHPTSVTVGAGTSAARTTKKSYNADGNILTQTDGLGRVTTYGYDSYGRLTSMTDPLGRKSSTTYDAAGNPLTLVDPSGRTTTFTYDAVDRMLTTKFSDGVTKGITATTYDAAGRRTSMTDGTGTITSTYDDLNQLISRKDGAGATVGYSYDKRGLLTTLTYPGGVNKVTRGYDAAGRMTSVQDWLGHTSTFGYDANSNLVTTTLGNGDVIKATFDAADQSAVLNLLDGSTSLKRVAYTRDVSGMITAEDAKAYAYDQTHRLTSAEGTALGYDAADRRTVTGGTAFNYDAADELLSTVTAGVSTTYTYDKQGNRTKRTATAGVTTYGFDQAGHLASLDNTGYGHHTFSYDGDGLRVSKYIGGTNQTQKYTWNVVEGLPTILTDGGSAYVTGPGGLPLEQITGSTVLYYFHDHLGSTRVLTNQDGTVNTTYEYTADGVLKSRTGSAYNPFQFAGQYLDATTGLYHMRARYYDPATAQFISRDPAVATTRQPYAYANDNPVNLSDPSGLYTPTPGGCGAADSMWSNFIPNNPLGFSFEGACANHDFCYGAGMAKSFCDDHFVEDVQAACVGEFFEGACGGLGDFYAWFPENMGSDAYWTAQDARAADLASHIAACGGNTECITQAANEANLDNLINQLIACRDNQSCENIIGAGFDKPIPTPDPGYPWGEPEPNWDWYYGDYWGDWGDVWFTGGGEDWIPYTVQY